MESLDCLQLATIVCAMSCSRTLIPSHKYLTMDASNQLNAKPLCALTIKSKRMISCLLNTKKVLPTDGPEKLPRDWRGLAAQVNLTLEITTFIEHLEDKTAKIFDLWSKKNDGTATVEQLFSYLHRMDRYDIYDDLLELHKNGELIDPKTTEISPCYQINRLENQTNDLITFHDVKYGSPQFYHAYVLYAREDKKFVDELLQRMKANGFKLCTEDDLLPGHATQYGPVSRLISERCYRIILIYSPDFLNSRANHFYMDYAQAVGIESKETKLIPCIYRHCQLPTNLTYYHKLYYTPPGQEAPYDFWEKLSRTLAMVNLPRLTNETASPNDCTAKITEMKSHSSSYSIPIKMLSLPSYIDTLMVTLPSVDCKFLSNPSQVSDQKHKKMSTVKKLCNNLRGKKNNLLMIEI